MESRPASGYLDHTYTDKEGLFYFKIKLKDRNMSKLKGHRVANEPLALESGWDLLTNECQRLLASQ